MIFPDGRLATFDARMLDRAFEDRVVPHLARDVCFALTQLAAVDRVDPRGVLTGRLDLERVGAFGLSLGGQVSAEACRIEPRLRACLSMDVWMPPSVVDAGLDRPTMWISRDAATMQREGWTPADIDRTLSTMRAVFDTLAAPGYLVLVPGMFHVDFSDASLVAPLGRRLGISGPFDPRRARRIVGAYSRAFFDRHLRGQPAPLLDGAPREFPEVLFDARVP
ncbi:hypothetical protein BE18_36005 [Sorangium cellulosum]|uniref:Uncharacterized protein n=1 Tax=Sorangium cellulosum TaxID=56 RepID=A0A150SE83_SORCE|nr:hypothetical protein BE18_36005 [Sorangium cellulosum]